MKKIFCLLCWLPAMLLAAPSALIVSFDGKGLAMGWDFGVMQALTHHWREDTIGERYFVGSSSGALVASYFACHGLSSATVDQASKILHDSPRGVLSEDEVRKSLQMLLGFSTEISIDTLSPAIDQVTENGTCLPALPLLIPAANLEVIDGRIPGEVFSGRRGRAFDYGLYTVSENGQVVGKACTYFVNEPMAQVLRRIPAEQRLCDLRFIRSPADLRLALVASVAEPTYYPPIPEPDPAQLESVFPLPKERHYAGGSILNSPLQDVKRALPAAWALGTGRPPFTRMENRLLHNWFSFYINQTLLDQRWWFDAQIPIGVDYWKAMKDKHVSLGQQMDWGARESEKCFTAGACIPKIATRPALAGNEPRARGLGAISK